MYSDEHPSKSQRMRNRLVLNSNARWQCVLVSKDRGDTWTPDNLDDELPQRDHWMAKSWREDMVLGHIPQVSPTVPICRAFPCAENILKYKTVPLNAMAPKSPGLDSSDAPHRPWLRRAVGFITACAVLCY